MPEIITSDFFFSSSDLEDVIDRLKTFNGQRLRLKAMKVAGDAEETATALREYEEILGDWRTAWSEVTKTVDFISVATHRAGQAVLSTHRALRRDAMTAAGKAVLRLAKAEYGGFAPARAMYAGMSRPGFNLDIEEILQIARDES